MRSRQSLWVRIKGRTHDIVVGVYYRPPDQEDQTDEDLYRQIEAASCSQGLDFLQPGIRESIAGHRQPRRNALITSFSN